MAYKFGRQKLIVIVYAPGVGLSSDQLDPDLHEGDYPALKHMNGYRPQGGGVYVPATTQDQQ